MSAVRVWSGRSAEKKVQLRNGQIDQQATQRNVDVVAQRQNCLCGEVSSKTALGGEVAQEAKLVGRLDVVR
ncbi:hypothetical protein J6590_081329 [Homalodisca vitripennis]|nr:hypothetical protein J6590_081329 [Homalodisca vitripennis]